jgi:hypothetical protein
MVSGAEADDQSFKLMEQLTAVPTPSDKLKDLTEPTASNYAKITMTFQLCEDQKLTWRPESELKPYEYQIS